MNEVHAQAIDTEARTWRTKRDQEVDFVFVRRGRTPLAVECKRSEASFGRLRGLRAFAAAYPGAEALIVVPDLKREYPVALGDTATATVVDLEGLIRHLTDSA